MKILLAIGRLTAPLLLAAVAAAAQTEASKIATAPQAPAATATKMFFTSAHKPCDITLGALLVDKTYSASFTVSGTGYLAPVTANAYTRAANVRDSVGGLTVLVAYPLEVTAACPVVTFTPAFTGQTK